MQHPCCLRWCLPPGHNFPCWSACDHRVWLSQVQSHRRQEQRQSGGWCRTRDSYGRLRFGSVMIKIYFLQRKLKILNLYFQTQGLCQGVFSSDNRMVKLSSWGLQLTLFRLCHDVMNKVNLKLTDSDQVSWSSIRHLVTSSDHEPPSQLHP